jgi:hypothetical protein
MPAGGCGMLPYGGAIGICCGLAGIPGCPPGIIGAYGIAYCPMLLF